MTFRTTFVWCAPSALALFLVLTPAVPQAQGGGPSAQAGQQGGLPALQARVQALEAGIAELSAVLDALKIAVSSGDATLQGQITTLGRQLAGLQDLFGSLNAAVNTAQGDIARLQGQVATVEAALAALGGGLTSYDQLAGLPCTTALGIPGTVTFMGLLKTPICADGLSANGRFIDFGLVLLDTQTSLLWEKKTTVVGSGQNLADLHDVDNTYDWSTATGNWIAAVNAEVFAGFSNWRVPTRDELLTIVNMNTGPPRIDPIFGPTWAAFYWSSTEVDGSNGFDRWIVHFDIGGASEVDFRFFDVHVRAVRAGP